jgi:histone-lysine N-methyltransferase SETMAR
MDLCQQIEEILQEDKNATTRTMALQLNVAQDTVWRHLKKMGKRYLCNTWIPHSLSDGARQKRVEICTELLAMYRRNNFLHQLVTGDEIWVYWENQGSVFHKSWRGPNEAPNTEPRRTLTVKKHLATVFWDCRGVLLIDVLPCGQTITAAVYSSILDRLKVAILQKRRRRTTDGFLHLLHDNARPHTAAMTKAKLEEIGLQLLPHPPYSPDLAPSDFYLFSPMKAALRGKSFTCAEDTQADIERWIATKDSVFFADGINKLPGRWERCVAHGGSYFEHLQDNDE